jgi:hypothetical protein
MIELKNFEYEYSIVEADLMFDHQYLLPLGPTSPRCDESRIARQPGAFLARGDDLCFM